jgi:enoyl-CoA hydratase/carnithine racemase
LNRPDVHNAYNTELKDLLCEALQLAHSDHSIEQVSLRGRGASFGAGGDLSEFGSVEDAALAHLSRTTRSAGALLATLPCASDARVHGACIGAGIELPAFAQRISAHPDTFFQLPEVAMGLIPGAGGTVSILHRIGRQRTTFMALSNRRIDVSTALSWGLVDVLLS